MCISYKHGLVASGFVSIGLIFMLIHVYTNRPSNDSFKVWWNVPTEMCHKYGLNFSEITMFGLEQNSGDSFLGDKITILYDPGLYPSLEKGAVRNGGVPQEGDLNLHLKSFKQRVNQDIPDENFSGIGIIDFEDWRPIWRENWGKLDVYREKSIDVEKSKHPSWSDSKAKLVATSRFEKAGYGFFDYTLQVARSYRPKARWGYYGYPFCFNYSPKNQGMHCSTEIQKDNDRSKWLQDSSTALYPSLYIYKNNLGESKRSTFIEGRLNEAMRVAKKVEPNLPVIPYVTFKYPDSASFYSKTQGFQGWSRKSFKSSGSDQIIMDDDFRTLLLSSEQHDFKCLQHTELIQEAINQNHHPLAYCHHRRPKDSGCQLSVTFNLVIVLLIVILTIK